MTRLLSIESALERGFTLTTMDGKFVKTPAELKACDEIRTIFRDGEVGSEVRG
jgi:exonuclease VII large subunit